MRRTFLVSYPRSGQHFTGRFLGRIAGNENIYCELYGCSDESCQASGWPIAMKSPCYAGRPLQKTHDFDLALPQTRHFNYAVLFRRPMLSIQSYYEMELRSRNFIEINLGERASDKVQFEDSRRAWELFLIQKGQYWRDFVEKWIPYCNQQRHAKAFDYDKITTEADQLESVAEFCLAGYDREKMKVLIENQKKILEEGKFKLRDASEFRHFREGDADLLGEVIGQRALRYAGFDNVV